MLLGSASSERKLLQASNKGNDKSIRKKEERRCGGMTVDEAIETLRYEIDEECHCEYIADEIHLLIETVENQRLQLRESQLKGGEG